MIAFFIATAQMLLAYIWIFAVMFAAFEAVLYLLGAIAELCRSIQRAGVRQSLTKPWQLLKRMNAEGLDYTMFTTMIRSSHALS